MPLPQGEGGDAPEAAAPGLKPFTLLTKKAIEVRRAGSPGARALVRRMLILLRVALCEQYTSMYVCMCEQVGGWLGACKSSIYLHAVPFNWVPRSEIMNCFAVTSRNILVVFVVYSVIFQNEYGFSL